MIQTLPAQNTNKIVTGKQQALSNSRVAASRLNQLGSRLALSRHGLRVFKSLLSGLLGEEYTIIKKPSGCNSLSATSNIKLDTQFQTNTGLSVYGDSGMSESMLPFWRLGHTAMHAWRPRQLTG